MIRIVTITIDILITVVPITVVSIFTNRGIIVIIILRLNGYNFVIYYSIFHSVVIPGA